MKILPIIELTHFACFMKREVERGRLCGWHVTRALPLYPRPETALVHFEAADSPWEELRFCAPTHILF